MRGKAKNRSWPRENTKPRTIRSRHFEQEATEKAEVPKAKTFCPAPIEICRPSIRALFSFESALCSLCYLLFKVIWLRPALCVLCVLLWQSALADVHYVDVNSTNATPPYANWTTAATNIQDAVDAALAGDEIVVTNGTYATGGRTNDYGLNRVLLDKPLSLRSASGPQATTIFGGNSCVYLTNGATLSGFTLTHGVGILSGTSGRGVWCESASAVVSNCVITRNYAFGSVGSFGGYGGGAFRGTLNNCTLTGNQVFNSYTYGGGAAFCTLNNCVLSGNSAGFALGGPFTTSGFGGGASSCTLNNCTLTRNSVSSTARVFSDMFGNGGGTYGCTLRNCISSGNWVSDHWFGQFENNYAQSTLIYCWTADPLFVDDIGSNLRLQSNSPCINAGNNSYVTTATDLDGNPRIVRGTVDTGAYEFQGGVHYVDVSSTNATPPYTNWTTAATNIQDAVDAAVEGDEIVVTNGTYATGARATVDDNTANRVMVDKPLNLRSVNGPEFTTINGGGQFRCVYLNNSASFSGFTLTNGLAHNYTAVGGGGVRCQSANVVISNCLITGNRVVAYSSINITTPFVAYGGGAAGGALNNCMLTGNSVTANADQSGDTPEAQGGGAYGCTLNDCTLSGNSASTGSSFGYSGVTVHAAGGGAYGCTLNNCTLSGNTAIVPFSGTPYGDAQGGGAIYSTLNSCELTANSAIGDLDHRGFNYGAGGGASYCSLNNCTLAGNYAGTYGGGASYCTLTDCTLAGNSAWYSYGGVRSSTLNNCIVYYNIALVLADLGSYGDSTLNYCCTTPQPTNGVGNITIAPVFMDTNGWANLRLQPTSPCINAGNNSSVTNATDLDGNPRISGGTVDIGAYEFQAPVSQISYAWLQRYGLPINSSTDTADPDGDGVDNYHEWLAGTDPTNPLWSPAQLTITPSDTSVILTWSTNAVGFTLQSTTNLGSATVWSTNLPAPVVIEGQNMVTNPISGPQQFYRLSQ
jgi:hypothetical protein